MRLSSTAFERRGLWRAAKLIELLRYGPELRIKKNPMMKVGAGLIRSSNLPSARFLKATSNSPTNIRTGSRNRMQFTVVHHPMVLTIATSVWVDIDEIVARGCHSNDDRPRRLDHTYLAQTPIRRSHPVGYWTHSWHREEHMAAAARLLSKGGLKTPLTDKRRYDQ